MLEWALTLRDGMRKERGQDDQDISETTCSETDPLSGLTANLNGSHVNCNGQQASLGRSYLHQIVNEMKTRVSH